MTSNTALSGRADGAAIQVPQWRALLEEQWRHYVGEITRLSLDFCDLQVSVGSDAASRVEQLRKAARSVAAERHALTEVEAALSRLSDGTYGICEHCGDAIAWQRLEILPQTRYCVGCQPRRQTGR